MAEVISFKDEVKKDTYDGIVDGIAEFGGVCAYVLVRYATFNKAPANDSIMKKVLREVGSVSLASVAMNATNSGVKYVGKTLKPYLVRK